MLGSTLLHVAVWQADVSGDPALESASGRGRPGWHADPAERRPIGVRRRSRCRCWWCGPGALPDHADDVAMAEGADLVPAAMRAPGRMLGHGRGRRGEDVPRSEVQPGARPTTCSTLIPPGAVRPTTLRPRRGTGLPELLCSAQREEQRGEDRDEAARRPVGVAAAHLKLCRLGAARNPNVSRSA